MTAAKKKAAARRKAPPVDNMARVVAMAKLLADQTARFERLEEEAAEAKKEMLRTEREDLPMLMEEIGMKEYTLLDGSEVTIRADCTTTLTEAKRAGALQWLLDNDFGGLIKTEVTLAFGRGDRAEATNVLKQLLPKYPQAGLTENVHHSTLKSFVMERLNGALPLDMDLFSVNKFDKAVIKQPKKGKKA